VSSIPPQNAAKAAAHPLRATILEALGRRVYSPNELANEPGERLGNVSYHVKALRDLGMIKLVDTQPRRGAVEHYYKAVWQVRVEVEPVE
jgi:DNA-binding transcriptional ArsR family regulator